VKQNKFPLIIIAITLIFAVLNFSPIPFAGGDNFAYYLLGKALAQGRGYVELWTAGNPLHTKYPPVFPVMLIPAGLFDSYLIAKITVMICFVIMLWFTWKFFEAVSSKRVALLALAIFAFAPVTIEYSSLVLSEIPYLMFSMIALYMATQKKYLPAMIFAILTFLTRTIGFMLVVAVAWYCWKEGEKT